MGSQPTLLLLHTSTSLLPSRDKFYQAFLSRCRPFTPKIKREEGLETRLFLVATIQMGVIVQRSGDCSGEGSLLHTSGSPFVCNLYICESSGWLATLQTAMTPVMSSNSVTPPPPPQTILPTCYMCDRYSVVTVQKPSDHLRSNFVHVLNQDTA